MTRQRFYLVSNGFFVYTVTYGISIILDSRARVNSMRMTPVNVKSIIAIVNNRTHNHKDVQLTRKNRAKKRVK